MFPSVNRLRHLLLASGIALAVLFGQHAAALHDLAHATAQLGDKGGKLPAPCDQCFACAQLSGGATATPPAIPLFAVLGSTATMTRVAPVFTAQRVAFRSRAPPVLS